MQTTDQQSKIKCGNTEYHEALLIAENIKAKLGPHCFRREIAGSIRRKKPVVKDIEPCMRETNMIIS